MKADPSCRRQEILPVSLTARLALNPRKIPKAVQSCQDMTKPPRMTAGVFSAQKIGIVEAFRPIPIPRRRRTTNNCIQFWVTAEPMGVRTQKIDAMKIVPRRPRIRLQGSESQHPRQALAMYGAALTIPTSHKFRLA